MSLSSPSPASPRAVLSRAIDVASSAIATGFRLGAGFAVMQPLGPRPARPLELYEFEGCPFCRKVREALTALDLEAIFYPCPKGGTRFRSRVTRSGAKRTFPFLVDPNTGVSMFESRDIVCYLFENYGARRAPWWLYSDFLTPLGSLASAIRFPRGIRSRSSHAPEQPLELYSFDGSPYCRIVRETLCELELDYLLHNVGKGSPSRAAFIERSGRMMVPWLFDPSRGIGLFESADIRRYLIDHYAA